jgi:hypothetical protein
MQDLNYKIEKILSDYKHELDNEFELEKELALEMLTRDLIGIGYSINITTEAVKFTQKAKDIISNGGWLRHLSAEKEESDINFRKKRIEFEKLERDNELSKRIYKDYSSTKWISRIGLLLAITSLIWQIVREFIPKHS